MAPVGLACSLCCPSLHTGRVAGVVHLGAEAGYRLQLLWGRVGFMAMLLAKLSPTPFTHGFVQTWLHSNVDDERPYWTSLWLLSGGLSVSNGVARCLSRLIVHMSANIGTC